MIVTFDVFVNGKKENTIIVGAQEGLFKSTLDLVKEVKYLGSEFKTHCFKTGGAYHPAHFMNYIRKYTRLTVSYGFPVTVERIDF